MLNIVVCVKAVPDPKEACNIKIDPATKTLMRCDVPFVVNPLDKNAMEAALTLKEQVDTHISVLSMGPPDAGNIVKDRKDPYQIFVALFSMCMRSLTYECYNLYSKRWALLSATLLAKACIKTVRRQFGLMPDRISLTGISHIQGGSLGIFFCELFCFPQRTFPSINIRHLSLPWLEQRVPSGGQARRGDGPRQRLRQAEIVWRHSRTARGKGVGLRSGKRLTRRSGSKGRSCGNQVEK